MANGVRSFRDLHVWQQSMSLVVVTYRLCRTLPSSEKFGLISQMQRAAVSIPANIAEGHSRRTRSEYAHFVSISSGSLAELDTEVELCERLEIGNVELIDVAREKVDVVGKMLNALQTSLKPRHRDPNP